MRLGFNDAGNRPTSDTTRRAYDLVSEGFGPGFNGPLLLTAATPDGAQDVAALQKLSDTLNDGVPGVAFATSPQTNSQGDVAIMQVFPTTDPQDKATADLVNRLRDNVIPSVVGNEVDVKVGGLTAAADDFASYTASRLPLFVGAVLVLSFLLLMLVFRSLLVPLKAVIMNLLSIGAAYGVIVAVFQWGWGASLIGVGREGPIEAWAPVFIFAIVFGLSMDYEVFLLSRIREEYDRTGDNATAVADGLALTARVITAAAAIMFCVFGSFVFGPEVALEDHGARARRRGVDRRDGRATRARAVDDGTPRRLELVDARVARSHPAARACRSRQVARGGARGPAASKRKSPRSAEHHTNRRQLRVSTPFVDAGWVLVGDEVVDGGVGAFADREVARAVGGEADGFALAFVGLGR